MALTRDAFFWQSFSALADCSVRASGYLSTLLADLDNSARHAEDIRRVEAEGDRITHEAIAALHQTWITPLDRNEIHTLVTALDDVLDFIKAASERLLLFELKDAPEEAGEIATLLGRGAGAMKRAIDSLTSLKDPRPVLQLCIEINEVEDTIDDIYRRGLARLYKGGSDPMRVLMWREILEAMETASDRCEDIAHVIEGIVLEHA